MESTDITVLIDFLRQDVREDLRMVALREVLSLTGSEGGCSIIQKTDIGQILLEYSLNKNEILSKLACLSLINISASEKGADFVWNSFTQRKENVLTLIENILNSQSSIADVSCMILSNLTRKSSNAAIVMDIMQNAGVSVADLINIFTKKNFNSKGCNLNYLGPIFSNLSQNFQFRRCLMLPETYLIKKLLPFVNLNESLIRKGGIVGTLRNCCFETEYHKCLLGPDIDILPCLLLPLAGPEEFDEEDNEKLPIELQYLDENKERESDLDIRKMLLEALLQLCATKFGRELLRSKNAYVILREYHKWEQDKHALLACENIVDILIRTEDEINTSNIKEIEIPDELISKFEELDRKYREDD